MTTARDATEDDLPAACAIAAATLDLDAEDAERLPRLLWAEDDGTRRIRLVADDDGGVAGVLLGSLQGPDAFLDLVAVRPAAQGRGIARSLLAEWERRGAAASARRSLVGENLRTYAWPGVDVRYTAALALLLRRGYVRTKTVYNMDLQLADLPARATDGVARLAAAGIVVRRGRPEDGPAVQAHAERLWPEVWARETATALRREPPPIFLALRDDRVVGFAAHGLHRPSLYGPIATDPDEQGHGIGAVLSALCLDDMAARGVRTAQIGWVAESAIPFYSRTAGARLGRCFWMMAKPLAAQEERG